MDNFQIRTDLALEARESVNEEESKLRGVSVEEHYEEEADLRITKVTIDTKNAEKMLGKPMGVYVTMEAPAMVEPDDDYHREISEALAAYVFFQEGRAGGMAGGGPGQQGSDCGCTGTSGDR